METTIEVRVIDGIRLAGIAVLSAAALIMSPSASHAETLVTTADGGEYYGEVISGGVNTLTMKLMETGYEIVPVNAIVRIKVDIAGSDPIEGRFIEWSDGEITLRLGDRDVAVRDGTVVSVRDVTVPAGGPDVAAEEAPSAAPPGEAEPTEQQSAPITNATM